MNKFEYFASDTILKYDYIDPFYLSVGDQNRTSSGCPINDVISMILYKFVHLLSLIHTYEANADARRRRRRNVMWPPYEASNFEARFDARISKLFDIVASNSIVFCICVIIFTISMNTIFLCSSGKYFSVYSLTSFSSDAY